MGYNTVGGPFGCTFRKSIRDQYIGSLQALQNQIDEIKKQLEDLKPEGVEELKASVEDLTLQVGGFDASIKQALASSTAAEATATATAQKADLIDSDVAELRADVLSQGNAIQSNASQISALNSSVDNLGEYGQQLATIANEAHAQAEANMQSIAGLPEVQAGGIDAVTVGAGKVVSVNITFPKAFAVKPKVVVSLLTGSTNAGYGNLSVGVYNITTAGFVAKFYNNYSSGSFSPAAQWVAVASN